MNLKHVFTLLCGAMFGVMAVVAVVHAVTIQSGANLEAAAVLPSLSTTPEAFGAKGDGVTDDTAALQKAVDSGNKVVLGEGKTYLINKTIVMPSNSAIVGSKGSVVLLGSAGFNNTSPSEGIYRASAVGFLLGTPGSNPPTGPSNVTLSGFRITKTYNKNFSGEAVVLWGASKVDLKNLVIDNFSNGSVIDIQASRSVLVSGNIIESSTLDLDTCMATHLCGQLTGISVDGNAGANVSATIIIAGNTIRNLTVSSAFLAKGGYQTDGITIAHIATNNVSIIDNQISNVGEGIDMFGNTLTVKRNTVTDAYAFGLKLIHGASDNLLESNTIVRAGLAGIIVSGSSSASTDAARNTVQKNSIVDTGASGVWKAQGADSIAGVSVAFGAAASFPKDNTFSGNVISSRYMNYGLLCVSGSGNLFKDNTVSGAIRDSALNRDGCGTMQGTVKGNLSAVSSFPKDTISALSFAPTVANDSLGEWTAATKTFVAKFPRANANLLVSVRTNTLAVGKAMTVRILKNGTPLASRTLTQTANIGDFWVSASATSPLAAGDKIIFDVSTNQQGGVTLTPAQEPYNFFIITTDTLPAIPDSGSGQAPAPTPAPGTPAVKASVKAVPMAAYTLPANTLTRLLFGKESSDAAGEWDTTASRYTAKAAGTLDIAASVRTSSASLNRTLTLYVYKNGVSAFTKALTQQTSVGDHWVSGFTSLTVVPGDVIEFYAKTDQPEGLPITPAQEPYNYISIVGR